MVREMIGRAIQVARETPVSAQDGSTRTIARTSGRLTAKDEASFDESLAQEERGEFVSDGAVRAFWAKIAL
jgi:hypothetical protein